jgi:hypothetical protein
MGGDVEGLGKQALELGLRELGELAEGLLVPNPGDLTDALLDRLGGGELLGKTVPDGLLLLAPKENLDELQDPATHVRRYEHLVRKARVLSEEGVAEHVVEQGLRGWIARRVAMVANGVDGGSPEPVDVVAQDRLILSPLDQLVALGVQVLAEWLGGHQGQPEQERRLASGGTPDPDVPVPALPDQVEGLPGERRQLRRPRYPIPPQQLEQRQLEGVAQECADPHLAR